MHAVVRRYTSLPHVLDAARPKLADLERTMRGTPGFVAYCSDEAPVNHAILGPEFTFTGEKVAGKITVGKPIGLTVADAAS